MYAILFGAYAYSTLSTISLLYSIHADNKNSCKISKLKKNEKNHNKLCICEYSTLKILLIICANQPTNKQATIHSTHTNGARARDQSYLFIDFCHHFWSIVRIT